MKTRRLLLMAMGLFMCLMLAAEEVMQVVIDGIRYVAIKKTGTAEVIHNYNSGKIVIPSSFVYDGKTYSVTSIGENAFWTCSGLTSITIPNSVTSIGGGAFSWCTSLTSITIPNSVTSIGESAFYNCSSLTSITIPSSVTSIGGGAFFECSGLASINVKAGNTKYDSRENCNAIIETESNTLIVGCQNTTIPNSVTSIGRSAFFYCYGLTSVTIPNSVTSIGESAFEGCSGLTSVTIPNSVTNIGKCAFYHCYGLTSVTIGNNVTNIGEGAFTWCPILVDVTCMAQSVPTTKLNAFIDGIPTLHVPEESVEAYKSTAPWSDFGTIVALPEEVLGDVNGDGEVSVTDVGMMISYILQTNPEGFNEDVADMNGDGEITVTDVGILITTILQGE